MKHLFLLLTSLFLISGLKSQNNLNWQNAILRADGLTEVDGIEAFCAKTTCNDEESLLVKFVNKNDHRVGLEWVDAIFINGVWYYSKNTQPKKLYIEAGAEVVGNCMNNDKLKVRIEDIIQDATQFQHYTVSGLKLVK